MSTVREDLESFQKFAASRLASGSQARSIDELFMEWHDTLERDEINEAIRQGIADVDAGHVSCAWEDLAAIRRDLGLADDEV